MKTCQYYKGTEQVGADSTRILCSYMASGGKVFKNNDPESAALIQCCWHAEKAERSVRFGTLKRRTPFCTSRMQFRMKRTKMLTGLNSTKVKSFRCLRTDSAR